MIASVSKYRSRERTIDWLNKLPQKFSLETVEKYLEEDRGWLIWTEEDGLI